jgi:predicted dehydrogenase
MSHEKDSPKPAETENAGTTRRDFLKTAALGVGGTIIAMGAPGFAATAAGDAVAKAKPKALKSAGLKPRVPMATGRVLGANDRIAIAHLGVGGQGGAHLHILNGEREANNTRSIGVSEVYTPRLEGAKAAILRYDASAQVQMEKDYRKLLENKDVDAVVIGTPEHWHAQMAIDAMEAGKHVYCEKPMTRYMDEGFAILAAVEKTGKVFQVGSQGTSDTKWRVANDVVSSGKIGPVVSCQGSYARNSQGGEWNYGIDEGANANNLDWKMWLGSAPDRPWNDDSKARFFRYRKYRDYSAGLLGDLMPHKLHPLMIAVFGDKPEFPIRVTALGTMKISTDREVADTIHTLVEFPSGITMYVFLSTVNEQGLEDVIRGHKATLRFGGGKVALSPERPYAEEIDAQEFPIVGPGEDIKVHEKNWLDCIRTGKTPNGNIGLAVRVQTIVSLAEMAELEHKTMNFDPIKRQIIA